MMLHLQSVHQILVASSKNYMCFYESQRLVAVVRVRFSSVISLPNSLSVGPPAVCETVLQPRGIPSCQTQWQPTFNLLQLTW